MKKITSAYILLLCSSLLLTQSCRKDTLSPDTPLVSFTIPQGWPAPYYSFANNTLTGDGFALGRKLFYDVRLSRDNTISCGSCHQQFSAFAHLDHAVSHGIHDLLGKRNAPPIFNLAWNTSFFWDGGVNNLENQPINPIQNPVEMDMTIPEFINKIAADADYKKRFSAAFGDETINSQRIFKALSQFMGVIVSANSRYDKYIRGEEGGSLTNQELHGLFIFRAKCADCHKEPLFTDFSFRNNGLMPTAANDSGRAHITRDPADLYKFRVPSLRNVSITAPYMHDGRFNNLEAALTHYQNSVYVTPTLDPLIKSMTMTNDERADIILFLNTLTDTAFTKDARFAEPK